MTRKWKWSAEDENTLCVRVSDLRNWLFDEVEGVEIEVKTYALGCPMVELWWTDADGQRQTRNAPLIQRRIAPRWLERLLWRVFKVEGYWDEELGPTPHMRPHERTRFEAGKA